LNLKEIYEKEKERRNWQNPEQTLINIGLKEGHRFADIGCGYGFFTLPALRMVGKSGKVYAVDKNAEAISIIRRRLSGDPDNIELVTGLAEDIVFCEGCIDFMFFSIVLHDFSDIMKVLDNSRKMIKKDGVLVNIDWKKKKLDKGPPYSKKFSIGKASGLIESAGYRINKIDKESALLYSITAHPA
jgi:ubiquinone/menaquinone biosynthesis C-methylase UbiE